MEGESSASSSGSQLQEIEKFEKKLFENLEDYFPSGVKRPRPLVNCGEEFAVRSSFWTEAMLLEHSLTKVEDDEVPIDPNVWGFLPDDLHARVLAKLPFAALVRFRIVCKSWNATIMSEGFKFSLNSRRKCVPLYFHEDVPCTVYNKKRNSWQQISFSFLETPSSLLSLLVSAGGLLCFKTGIAGELLVCNPITKQYRRLQVPCRILHDSISVLPLHAEIVYETGVCTSRLKLCHLSTLDKEGVVGMLMDREGRNYKLVVAGVTLAGCTSERTTLVYDSLTNSWKRGGDVPKGLSFWRTGKPVASNGSVYFISCCRAGWVDEFGEPRRFDEFNGRLEVIRPWGVVRYDVKSDKWRAVRFARRNSILFQLVEFQGRILIVQRRARDQTQMFTSELLEDGKVVPFLTSRIPVELFPDVRDLMIGDWCVGQGDQFFVAGIYPENSWQYLESGFYPTQLDKCLGFGVLTHNPTDDSWSQLPDLCGKFYTEGLYAFEPSLASV